LGDSICEIRIAPGQRNFVCNIKLDVPSFATSAGGSEQLSTIECFKVFGINCNVTRITRRVEGADSYKSTIGVLFIKQLCKYQIYYS
jgi:hypothetical protein